MRLLFIQSKDRGSLPAFLIYRLDPCPFTQREQDIRTQLLQLEGEKVIPGPVASPQALPRISMDNRHHTASVIPTGQWSDPCTSLWMNASLTLRFRLSDTKK